MRYMLVQGRRASAPPTLYDLWSRADADPVDGNWSIVSDDLNARIASAALTFDCSWSNAASWLMNTGTMGSADQRITLGIGTMPAVGEASLQVVLRGDSPTTPANAYLVWLYALDAAYAYKVFRLLSGSWTMILNQSIASAPTILDARIVGSTISVGGYTVTDANIASGAYVGIRAYASIATGTMIAGAFKAYDL